MKSISAYFLGAAIAAGTATVAPEGEPSYDLTWSTVDGGGTMTASGGGFELSGTAGQPDAGALTGGPFALTGGFWFAPPCPWDCAGAGDGVVDVVDFLALLAEWGQASVPCDYDGGGVAVTDFLELLAHWGACP
jgi:hypothetical protein